MLIRVCLDLGLMINMWSTVSTVHCSHGLRVVSVLTPEFAGELLNPLLSLLLFSACLTEYRPN